MIILLKLIQTTWPKPKYFFATRCIVHWSWRVEKKAEGSFTVWNIKIKRNFLWKIYFSEAGSLSLDSLLIVWNEMQCHNTVVYRYFIRKELIKSIDMHAKTNIYHPNSLMYSIHWCTKFTDGLFILVKGYIIYKLSKAGFSLFIIVNV